MKRNLYRVTGRAPASVIFRAGDSLTINYIRDAIPGRLTFSTRYLEVGYDVPVPGDLAVVGDVEAETTEEALTWLTVGRELASIISLAANAAISPVKGELAYDITPRKRERELFSGSSRPIRAPTALAQFLSTQRWRSSKQSQSASIATGSFALSPNTTRLC